MNEKAYIKTVKINGAMGLIIADDRALTALILEPIGNNCICSERARWPD